MWWNAMIFIEFPACLVRLMLMRKEFGSGKAQQCRCPQVGSTTASNSHSEHGESDCDMPRANAIWGRENPPGWTAHVAADIKFSKMLEVHPLGILLNYKCSCQWNYLLNGWPYIGSVFFAFLGSSQSHLKLNIGFWCGRSWSDCSFDLRECGEGFPIGHPCPHLLQNLLKQLDL